MLPSLIVILPPPLSGCMGALEGRREEGGGILSFSVRGGRLSPPLLLCPVVGEWLCQCFSVADEVENDFTGERVCLGGLGGGRLCSS